jgi:hypothetical protein
MYRREALRQFLFCRNFAHVARVVATCAKEKEMAVMKAFSTRVLVLALPAVLCAGLVPAVARAQDTTQGAAPVPSPAPPPAPPAPPAPPPPAATTTPPTSGAAGDAREERAEEDATTDHDRLVRRFGVTYFDITDLPIANSLQDPGNGNPATPPAGGITSSTVSAPIVGVRYWLQRTIGIDVGVGLGLAGGSTQAVQGTTSTTVDKTSTTGFALHGGVPLAFAQGRHYAFLVIPELTVGFTSATFKPPSGMGNNTGPEQDLSGFLFDVGARVGAEVYFGFIGIPQLALQATLGLSYRRSTFKWSSGNNSASDGTNTFGTNVQADPWAIFKDAISATYYF